jgi:hypothetical protein
VSNSLSGVAKAAVFPLFESAGRLHLALTGERADSFSNTAVMLLQCIIIVLI